MRDKHSSLVIMDKIPSSSNMALQRVKKGKNIELSEKITHRSSLCSLVFDNLELKRILRFVWTSGLHFLRNMM